jgi:hypothetical protein
MKKRLMKTAMAAVTILFAGCQYEAPLTPIHNIPVNPDLIGRWLDDSAPGKTTLEKVMLVLKYSDTEYLIHYPATDNGLYFRAYQIKVGDMHFLQIEMIGTGKGPLKPVDKDRFHVAAYTLEDGMLEVRMLNKEVVKSDMKTSDALYAAVLGNLDNENLYNKPGKFIKQLPGDSK